MKLCTKLVQWLTIAGVFFAVWTALVTDILPIKLSQASHKVVFIVSSCTVSLAKKIISCFSFLCTY